MKIKKLVWKAGCLEVNDRLRDRDRTLEGVTNQMMRFFKSVILIRSFQNGSIRIGDVF